MILQELMDACPNVGGKLLLDPCLLMRQAGQGGMGLVWKGYDVMKGRWAAVKLCGDREYWGRFYNEAHVGMTVHGEYALEIYDVRRLSKSGMPYILMEWVDGQDLQGVGRAIDLTASQIYTVALHTSRGLVAMHEKGVLHRDIKPANLMLTSEGLVKVVDFGISKGANAVYEPTAGSIGTRLFMAPETFTDAEPTRASDIYSLGVTLYVLARGLLDESVMVRTQLEQVMAGEHAPLLECLPQFDPDLARLIERCMARDPKARPQDASALLAALESLPLEPGGLRLGQTVIEDAEPGLEWIEEARRVLAEVPPAPDAPAGPQASGKGGTHLTPRVEPQRVPNAPIEAETQRRPRLSIPALTAMTAVALLALFAWASLLKGDGDPEPGGDEGEVAQAPVTQTDDSGESGGVDEPQDPPGTGSKGPDAVGELGEGSGTNTESTQTDETSESPDGPQPEPDPPILTPVGEGTIEGVPGDEDDESEESQPSPFELLFTQLDKPAEEEFTLYRLNYDLGLSAASQTYLRFLQTYSGVMVAYQEVPWALAKELEMKEGKFPNEFASQSWGPVEEAEFEQLVAKLNQRLSTQVEEPGFRFAIPTVDEWKSVADDCQAIGGGFFRPEFGGQEPEGGVNSEVGELGEGYGEREYATPVSVHWGNRAHRSGIHGLLGGAWEACQRPPEEGGLIFYGCSERETELRSLNTNDLYEHGPFPENSNLAEFYGLRLILKPVGS